MSSNPYVRQDVPEMVDLNSHAQSYHDEIARTLMRMTNGRMTVEAGTNAIMSRTMDFRGKMGQGSGLVMPEDRVALVGQHFEDIVNGRDTGAISSGLPCLDKVLLGGFQPGTMNVIAGVPGSGKSALLQQIGEYAAASGKAVLFVAVEMNAVQLSYRSLARLTGISATRIMTNRLSDAERDIVRGAIQDMKDMRIAYKDAGDMSTTGIYEAVLEQQRAMGQVDLIVADYLQILQDSVGGANENMRLECISRALLNIGKQLNCPILVGSQLNRESVKEGKRPQLHHLRGSGSIGQDATTVLLLHADHDGESEDERPNDVTIRIIVEKNRNGRAKLDIINSFFTSEQRFSEWHAKHQGVAGEGVTYPGEENEQPEIGDF